MPRPIAFGPVLVALTLIPVTLVFWPTFQNLLAIGIPGDEYTHRIFVIPIFVVTVWGLRFELATLPIRPFWPGLIALAGAGVIWLTGEITFIRLLTDIAAITMIPLTVLSVAGYRWLWALSFPLSYLLFAIPFLSPMVNLQVDWTARFTHIGLLASGVPVHREGAYFELPSGKWSIAEACSGTHYLSACMMLSVLYAWMMYTSTRKRIVFVSGAVMLGICGNWLRAYLTIWIAHISDNRFLRNDHGTFGWILFAALLFIYCLIGWYFRDHEHTGIPAISPRNDDAQPTRSTSRILFLAVSAIALAMLAAFPIISHSIARIQPSGPIEIARITPVAGWTSFNNSSMDWTPTLINPARERVQSFEKNGHQVHVFLGIFANQTWTSKLVTSVNNFIPSDSDRWSIVSRGTIRAMYLEGPLQVKTGIIIGGASRIMARQWYWIHGAKTGSDIQAKLEQLRSRLHGQDDVSAWVTVYTSADPSEEIATQRLDEFMKDMGLSMERALFQTTQR